MSVESKAQILTAIQSRSSGVRELVKSTRMRSQATVQLIHAMKAQGLIASERQVNGRGRPKETLRVTPLGLDYLKAYTRLSRVPLRASESELRKAVEDAKYASRLANGGVNPFKAFLELNAIVRASGDAT
jgi:DNA-binding PadR family transcriptional regulator